MTTFEFLVVPMIAAVLVGLIRGGSLRAGMHARSSGLRAAHPNQLRDVRRYPEPQPSSWPWISCPSSSRS